MRAIHYHCYYYINSPALKDRLWEGAGGGEGGCSSVGKAPNAKAKHNIDTGLTSQCGNAFFSHRQLPVQTLLQCTVPMRSYMHQNCAHVKNPQHWQPYQCPNTNKTLHTLVKMGSIALAAAVALAR